MRELAGQAMRDLLDREMAAHAGGIRRGLAPLDPSSATHAWRDTIRAVEEFINLPLFGLDDDPLERQILALPLMRLAIDPRAIGPIRQELATRFSPGVAQRFALTVIQAAAIGLSFRQHGLLEAAAGFDSVAHAVGYFQSRRRHMVALLYTLPEACTGAEPVARLDTLNLFLPLIELNGIALTGLYQQAMLAVVYPNHKLLVDAHGFSGNHSFEPLDALFLDPERASIIEMKEARSDSAVLETIEPVNPTKIFSAAELRNSIRLIEVAYREFDLDRSGFGAMAALVSALLAFCQDDYLISVPLDEFDAKIASSGVADRGNRVLVQRCNDYVQNTNAYAPFVRVGDTYLSSVTLLQRFLYYWKNVCLNKMRRFQIRSGFIFEETVKRELTRQGFHVTGIKRINRKEFDVVAVLDHVIYNFQCKNNLVDLSRIESDLIRFARYNRNLDRYYRSALAKEGAREQLLRDELNIDKVRHFVLSRFPVATTEPRVIPFSKIDELRAIISA